MDADDFVGWVEELADQMEAEAAEIERRSKQKQPRR